MLAVFLSIDRSTFLVGRSRYVNIDDILTAFIVPTKGATLNGCNVVFADLLQRGENVLITDEIRQK